MSEVLENTSPPEPKFGSFDDFHQYIKGGSSSAISPKKFGEVLGLDMQTVASRSHVHRNTLSRRPETESVQNYLVQNVKVIRAILDITDDVENAIYWFKTKPIPTFDYKTAEELVAEGRSDDLIRYIKSLQAGFAG
jgi:transcriptional regulator with XRE-family HTH domain